MPIASYAENVDNTKEDIDAADETDAADQAEQKGPLTGNFTLTSNYVFRGVSLSNNQPAVQSAVTFSFLSTGVYLNLWGSNAKLVDAVHDEVSTYEVDTVLGITNKIGKDFSYDISLIRYNYFEAPALSYKELNVIGTYKIFNAHIGYSNDVFGVNEDGTYYSVGVNYDLPPTEYSFLQMVSLMGSIGHYSLPSKAGHSYNDYMLGIKKTINRYKLSLQWTGTNGKLNLPPLDDNHIIATLSIDF